MANLEWMQWNHCKRYKISSIRYRCLIYSIVWVANYRIS